MENYICNQYGDWERLAILNNENIKICGWITKLEAIKKWNLFAFSSTTAENLNFYSARNARVASAVLAKAILSVRLSVRPSVRHTPVLCQNDGT